MNWDDVIVCLPTHLHIREPLHPQPWRANYDHYKIITHELAGHAMAKHTFCSRFGATGFLMSALQNISNTLDQKTRPRCYWVSVAWARFRQERKPKLAELLDSKITTE